MNATSIIESTRAMMPRVPMVLTRFELPPARVSRIAAQALGGFSILLGLMEIAAPARLAALLGLDGKEGLLRAYGGREIGAGVAAFAGFLAPAMWARVGGDLLDLATLAIGRRTDRRTARNISLALGAVAGIALLDLCVAGLLSSRTRR